MSGDEVYFSSSIRKIYIHAGYQRASGETHVLILPMTIDVAVESLVKEAYKYDAPGHKLVSVCIPI